MAAAAAGIAVALQMCATREQARGVSARGMWSKARDAAAFSQARAQAAPLDPPVEHDGEERERALHGWLHGCVAAGEMPGNFF